MAFLNLNFGEKLSKAIDDAGFTREQFAELMGVEPSSVSRWCTNINEPRGKRKAKLLDLLKIDESYFMNSNIESKPPLEQAMLLTQAQLTALSTEVAEKGVKAAMDAINKPTVAVYDDSPKGMLHKLIEGLSDDEAKKIRRMFETWVVEVRTPAQGRYIRPLNLRKDKK